MTSRNRIVCPSCAGGRTAEKSAVVYERDGKTWYHCYRGKCDRPNGIYTGDPVEPGDQTSSTWPHLVRVPERRASELMAKYHLTDADYRLLAPLWATDMGMYWFPVYDASRAECGGVAKSLAKGRRYSYGETYQGSWYGSSGAETVVLVEDQISAVRVAGALPSARVVALLGGGMAPGFDQYLRLYVDVGTRIIVCLDSDVKKKSLHTAEKLRIMGYRGAEPRLLMDCDLKDMIDVTEETRRWACSTM